MSARSRGLRPVVWMLIGALVTLVAGFAWVRATGRVFRFPARLGDTTDLALRFDPAVEPPALLANDVVSETPRNIILIIVDGLGFSHLLAGRIALEGIDGRLTVERFPAAGWLDTHAHASVYTDSAASAAAMASGEKTAPGLLAITPDGEPLATVAERAVAAGKQVGLVTDSYLWDATPSAFVVHGKRRDYPNVASHMAASGATVLAGETHANLEEDDTDDGALVGVFREAGFAIARDPAAWTAAMAAEQPVVGLFTPGAIADDVAPGLADLASAAMERLSASPNGYFLLVETEEADTGAHNGDLDRVVGAVRALEAVVTRALVAAEDGETLVVVTADHETGGLMLLGGSDESNLRIRWGTSNHTAAPVPVFAYGPGASRFAGAHDNTVVGRTLLEFVSALPEPDAPPLADE